MKNSVRFRCIAVFLVSSLCVFALLLGCGGGGGKSSGGATPTPTPTPGGPGTPTPTPSPTPTPVPTPTPTPGPSPGGQTPVRFNINWGARSRDISSPSSALSMELVLSGARPGGGPLIVHVDRDANPAAHSQEVVSSDVVVPGTWQAHVTCFAQTGATGSVVGKGDATVKIASNGTGIGNIATQGTITRVELAGGQTVAIASSRDLDFACYDRFGVMVVVTPPSAFFNVGAGADKLTFVNGRAQGLKPGFAQVSASVDGVTSTEISVEVVSHATVAITPPSVTLNRGESQQFTATVAEAPDTSVTWSVQEAAGGSISSSGAYTAPSTSGVFHVVATSNFDPQKKAVAAVTVRSPGSQIVYQTEFDTPVGAEWNQTKIETTPEGGRKFLGQFARETVALSLGSLPAHALVTVNTRLFFIRTWDGNNKDFSNGPDVFQIGVMGGQLLLNSTFSNVAVFPQSDFSQSYPQPVGGGSNPAFTGAAESLTLGYIEPGGGRSDSVYDFSYSFIHSGNNLQLNFISQQTEGITNESWGIDSITVTVSG
ncbi:MAG: Ig-like domain-containing protein [Armatimonas sp.]